MRLSGGDYPAQAMRRTPNQQPASRPLQSKKGTQGIKPAASTSDTDGEDGSIPCVPFLWLGTVLVVLLAALLWFRQPLSEWLWPETRAQQLRTDAALALQQGRLTAADGSGALELYEAALALDPDRMETRNGLAAVGQAALAQARLAIEEHRYTDAQAGLAVAAQVTAPAAQIDALARQLREQQAGVAGIDRLLAVAAAAREAGRLDGSDNAALPLYQRALTLHPDHTEALEGREDTLSELLQLARRQLAGGDVAGAATFIRRVQAADPGHVDLPEALDALAQGVENHRRAADGALDRQRLTDALAGYRRVLAADPDHAEAAQGMRRVARAYAERSQRLAADFRFDDAEAALRQARAIEPDAAATSEAERTLVRARQAQSRLDRAAMPGSARDRQARVQGLLAEAVAAESRGDLLTPPGDSAFDKINTARALAPQDRAVRAASARLLAAAQTCFEDDLRGNRLTRAGVCLDARVALGDAAGDVREARQRLAQRWIAVGEQRLGAGEVALAAAALAAAGELDRDVPGLDAFAERVRAAAAAD